MLQAESTNRSTKISCYFVALLLWATCLLGLGSGNARTEPSQVWGTVLLVGLLTVPLLAYAASLKQYRVAIDAERFQLLQLPATVLAEHPMSTLMGWWSVRVTSRGTTAEMLHLDFKHGSRIRIAAADYSNYEVLERFLHQHFNAKQRG
ncbi:hypothetical protein [Hymenobacter sp. CRA2]|uniref:hypothetical protein n=1 Tax=Hymenobacter sp. CRA2 TaxID=1955620 RepID=UPI00098F3C78|nr:hypothetical protein [Hymenobacter sp. CRA2]OON68364.1 hypothetical protein B0919_14560 [Hymenobacter sp. CRA2]